VPRDIREYCVCAYVPKIKAATYSFWRVRWGTHGNQQHEMGGGRSRVSSRVALEPSVSPCGAKEAVRVQHEDGLRKIKARSDTRADTGTNRPQGEKRK